MSNLASCIINEYKYQTNIEPSDRQPVSADAERIIQNVCDWVYLQSMDRQDTVKTLMCMFDGVLHLNEESLNKIFDDMEKEEFGEEME